VGPIACLDMVVLLLELMSWLFRPEQSFIYTHGMWQSSYANCIVEEVRCMNFSV